MMAAPAEGAVMSEIRTAGANRPVMRLALKYYWQVNLTKKFPKLAVAILG